MRIRRAISFVLLLFLLIPRIGAQAYMNINYDEHDWPLDIAIDGQGTEPSLAAKAKRLTLPPMTLIHCAQGNLTGWNALGQITEADAERLFSALTEATVRELPRKQFTQDEQGCPAWLSLVMRLPSGKLLCMDLYTTFDGQTRICFQTPDYQDILYLYSSSETLWALVNRIARWEAYHAKALKEAALVRVYDWSAESGRGELLGAVENPKLVKQLSEAIIKINNHENGYLCASRYELAFSLPSGEVLPVYLVNPDSGQEKITLLTGAGVAKVSKKALSPVLELIAAKGEGVAASMTREELPAPDLPTCANLSWLEEAPIFYHETGGALWVWDETASRTIAVFPNDDQYIEGECQNPAIFIVESWSARRICSLETGDVLWEMTRHEDEHNFGGSDYGLNISGWYGEYVEGLPERLVVTRGKAPRTWAYLTDNRGKQITRCYQSLDALVWQGNRGVFMFSTYDPADYVQGGEWTDEGTSPYEYGPTYRCGLIDQDGNILAEARYTDIQVLSPAKFALGSKGEYSILDIS